MPIAAADAFAGGVAVVSLARSAGDVAGRHCILPPLSPFLYCTLPAFGIAVPLPVLLAAVPAIFLAGNLPISAAGVGTIQAGMLFCFHDYAMPQAILAFGLCYSAGFVFGRLPLALAASAPNASAAPATNSLYPSINNRKFQ